MTSTGLARRGSNFIPVETKETSELSSPLMTDRVHGGEMPPRALTRFWPSVRNDIPAIYTFSRTLIRFNSPPLVIGKEFTRRAIFPFVQRYSRFETFIGIVRLLRLEKES